jgi:hypothetical protein
MAPAPRQARSAATVPRPSKDLGGTNDKKPWHPFARLDSLSSEVPHGSFILRDDHPSFGRSEGKDFSVRGFAEANLLDANNVNP